MEFGTEQLNTFSTFTLDKWKDRVYYEGQKFPAGHFAAEILNFAGEVEGPLLDRICALTILVNQAACAEASKGGDVLAELRPQMEDAVSWIYTCPPFCYQEKQNRWEEFTLAMDINRFEQDCGTPPEYLPYIFLFFSGKVLKILISIYNFCLLAHAFERKHLRKLDRRTESFFAKAAYDCFDKDDTFLCLLEQMPFGDIEEFFSAPRMISDYKYMQEPGNTGEWIAVQRIVCSRLVDFYVFDLMNGLQHGHAPSQCQCCGRYFLTTNGHVPKYCDGIAPQDSQMTCRQYGAMMQQKEQNKQHPIYRLFATRTGTIRKHHQRGKISDDLRREALLVAEIYREKALMDKKYAANGYERDMKQEHVYAEARKRLK